MENERSNQSMSNSSRSSQQPSQMASAREQGEQAVEQGKQRAAEIAEDAKHKAGEAVGQAKQKASELTEEAKMRASDEFDTRKSQAVSRLDGVASALRQTSRELQNQDDDAIAQYTSAAADQVERFSHYLEGKDLRQLAGEVKSLAYRQPEMFVAGALAAGFLVGRFFKSSSAPGGRGESYSGYGYDNYRAQGSYYAGPSYSGESRGYGSYESGRDYGYRRGDESGRGPDYRDAGSNYGQTGHNPSSGAGRGFEQSGCGNYSGSGRSNPQDQPGRQGSSGSSARDQNAQGQSNKE